MITRRGLFGWLAGALGLSASKVLVVPQKMPQLIITLSEDTDPDDEFLDRFYEKWAARYAGPLPIVLSHGMKVEVIGQTSPCIEEHQGDYSWKVVGRTGAEVIEMLGQVAFGQPSNPIVGNVDVYSGALTPNEVHGLRLEGHR